MSIRQAYNRFRQFGGCRLLLRYARMGMLGTVVKALIKTVIKGKSIKDAYPLIRERVDRKLLRQFDGLMKRLVTETTNEKNGERSKTIWSCWWQGEDEAPLLAKACWESQQRYMPEGWKHVIVTKDNYDKYVSLPDDIVKKMEAGVIPPAMFSDILRLDLLIQHGGVWMDATVLCTGANYPAILLTCPLFMFQYRGAHGEFHGFSNWFISAERGNKALKIVRELLYQYWRDYDCTVEYYMFHLFVNTLAKEMPEMLDAMPKGNTWPTLMLGNKLTEPYDAQWWNKHIAHCCFHKLNYRKENTLEYSYCGHIIDGTDKDCSL